MVLFLFLATGPKSFSIRGPSLRAWSFFILFFTCGKISFTAKFLRCHFVLSYNISSFTWGLITSREHMSEQSIVFNNKWCHSKDAAVRVTLSIPGHRMSWVQVGWIHDYTLHVLKNVIIIIFFWKLAFGCTCRTFRALAALNAAHIINFWMQYYYKEACGSCVCTQTNCTYPEPSSPVGGGNCCDGVCKCAIAPCRSTFLYRWLSGAHCPLIISAILCSLSSSLDSAQGCGL